MTQPGRIRDFEVIVFNQEVRERLAMGFHHQFLDDAWAEPHHEEIKTRGPEDARQKAERRYPASRGFVIVEIIEVALYD
ncbi:MAG: hypothetical protein FJX56_02395 [Alphaproteobacteria bacterium]|nr:hypothetical protein [Alphaproteobacteria bacterium]